MEHADDWPAGTMTTRSQAGRNPAVTPRRAELLRGAHKRILPAPIPIDPLDAPRPQGGPNREDLVLGCGIASVHAVLDRARHADHPAIRRERLLQALRELGSLVARGTR